MEQVAPTLSRGKSGSLTEGRTYYGRAAFLLSPSRGSPLKRSYYTLSNIETDRPDWCLHDWLL